MILFAALKLENCPGYEDMIIPCFRHGDGYKILHNLMKNELYKYHVIEGFITNCKTFLNRKEAYQYAISCGQLSTSTKQLKNERKEDELYSEDLY